MYVGELKNLKPLLYYQNGNDLLDDNCLIYVKDHEGNVARVVSVDSTQIKTKSKFFKNHEPTKKHLKLTDYEVYSLTIPRVKPENVCKVLDMLKTDNKSLWRETNDLFEFYAITTFLGCSESIAGRISYMFRELVEKSDKLQNRNGKLEKVNNGLMNKLEWEQKSRFQNEAVWSERVRLAEGECKLWKSMYQDRNDYKTPVNRTFLSDSDEGSTLQLLELESIEYKNE